MCKFPGKILMLAVMALLLSVGVAIADSPTSDWNNSWGFPSPAEKANLLNQAIAIKFVEEDGFNVNNTNTINNKFFHSQHCEVDGACENEFQLGNTIAIGSQVNVDIDGDHNNVNGTSAHTEGNVAAQINGEDGEIEQEIENEYEFEN